MPNSIVANIFWLGAFLISDLEIKLLVLLQYDSSYSRPTTDSKKLSDSSLRIGQKYGTYGTSYQKEEPSAKERGILVNFRIMKILI